MSAEEKKVPDSTGSAAKTPRNKIILAILGVLFLIALIPVGAAIYAVIHLSRMPDPERPARPPKEKSTATHNEVLPGAEYLDVERKPITLDEVRAAVKQSNLKGLSPEERAKVLSDVAERLPTLSDAEINRLVHDPIFLLDVLMLTPEERYALGKPYLRCRQWRFIRNAYIYSKLPESEKQVALDRQLDEFSAGEKASQSDFIQRQIDKLLTRLYISFKQQKDADDATSAASGQAARGAKASGQARGDEFGIYPPDISDELRELAEQYRKALIARSKERRAAREAQGARQAQ